MNDRWVQHFKEILNQPIPTQNVEFEQTFGLQDINIELFTPDEISKAISKLKNNKAPGIDEIHPEMIKYGGDFLIKMLTSLCNKIWQKEAVPKD